MKKRLFPALLFSVLLFGCSGSGTIEEVDWMLGHWAGLDENDLTFHENWRRGEKGTFVGTGCTLSPDGDTLWKESLKVEMVEGVPYYVADVPGNKGAVLFKMIKGDEKEAVFENKDHDFPQRITYTLNNTKAITVKLEGIEAGKPRIQKLAFNRLDEITLPH
jgi:Domain of unknown function (DUF6265)